MIEIHQRGQIPIDDAATDLYDVADQEAEPSGVTGSFQAFVGSRFANSRARLVEAPFGFEISGLQLRGRVDAVFEPEPRHWEIVDFKSGRPRTDPAGHLQLEAYAVAAESGALGPKPDRITVTFAYLGGGLEERSEVVDDEWLTSARVRISHLASGIAAKSYDPQPGAGCHGCDFLRFCPAGQRYLKV